MVALKSALNRVSWVEFVHLLYSIFFIEERGGVLKGWSRGAEILEARHRPQEWMSSSPCPLLAEEWNYPSLCAHTSFLLQMTSFPSLELTPTIYTHFTFFHRTHEGSFWGVPATVINRVSHHGLANAAHSHWGNPSEASYGPREMSEHCCEDPSISAYRDGDISYLSPI